MNSAQQRPRKTPTQRPTSGPWRLRLRRLSSSVIGPFRSVADSRRTHRRQPIINQGASWHGNRPSVHIARYLSYAGAVSSLSGSEAPSAFSSVATTA
jgi:hypothetical protein